MLLMLGPCRHTCSSLLKRGGHDAADAGSFLPHVPIRAERQASDAADAGALLPHVLVFAETWG